MISVEVDKISPTLSGLRLGCVVRYGKDGPVRFCQAVLPWKVFTRDVQSALVEAFNRMLDEEPEDDPLF